MHSAAPFKAFISIFYFQNLIDPTHILDSPIWTACSCERKEKTVGFSRTAGKEGQSIFLEVNQFRTLVLAVGLVNVRDPTVE